MKQDIHALAQRLKRVPAGAVQIISESGSVPRQAQTKGKGIIEPYAVFDALRTARSPMCWRSITAIKAG